MQNKKQKENNIQWQKQKESFVLKRIDQIVRKPINQQACKDLVAIAKDKDLSYLSLLISTAEKYFAPAFFLWHKYERKIGTHVGLLMNILHSKITYGRMEQFKTPFERLKDKYQKTTRKRVTLLDEAQIKMHPTDDKLKAYVNECEKGRNEADKAKPTSILAHQDKQQNKQQQSIVAPLKELGINYLETRISVLKDMYYKVKMANENPKKRQEDAELVEKLEERPVFCKDCLNCLPLVYEDEDLTYPMGRQPVTFFGKILTISHMQRHILQQIVSYLNGKGGVLLIGTQKVGHKVVPIVQEVTESHKQQQQNRIQSLLALIAPSINKHIDLKFIPIAENPRKHLQQTKPVWKDFGACILRITVLALEPHQTYYYNSHISPSSNQNAEPLSQSPLQSNQVPAFHYFSRNTEQGDQELKDQAVYDFMKNRYREYDPSNKAADFVLRERGNCHPCLIEHIHSCRPAEKGKPYYGNSDILQYPSKPNNLEPTTNPLLNGIQNFKNISLLVVTSSLIDKIRDIFTNEQKLQCKIEHAFEKERFKLSNNTFLVFHNCKYQKLKNGLSKSKATLKAENQKKEVHLISTLPFIAFQQQKLNIQIQEELKEMVMEVSKEKIEIRSINNVVYIKCSSTITAVYIYFYMHHHYSAKGMFQKIPTGSEATSKLSKKVIVKDKQQQKGNKRTYNNNNRSYERDQHEEFDKREERPRENRNWKEKHEQQKYKNDQDATAKYQGYPNQSGQNPNNTQDKNQETNLEFCKQLIYSQYDTLGNRFDFYNDSIVYMFNMYGQYIGCQYYQMQT